MITHDEIVLALYVPPEGLSLLLLGEEKMGYGLVVVQDEEADNVARKLSRMPRVILLGEAWAMAQGVEEIQHLRQELSVGEIPILVLGSRNTELSWQRSFLEAGLEFLPGTLWPDVLLPWVRRQLLRFPASPPPRQDAPFDPQARKIIHDLNNVFTVIHGNAEIVKSMLATSSAPYSPELREMIAACVKGRDLTRALQTLFGARKPL